MEGDKPMLTGEQLEEVGRLARKESTGWEYLVSGAANHVFRITHSAGSFIVKMCKTDIPELFRLEAEGLSTLAQTGTVPVPPVLGYSHKYLLMEDLGREGETAGEEAWYLFGRQFGMLHRVRGEYFGYPHDNYLGIWRQRNTPTEGWVDFFYNHRVACYFHAGRNDEFLRPEDLRGIEGIFRKMGDLVPDLPPALCHGDFWMNNVFRKETGGIVLIDPAIHYGHPEADLAMTKMYTPFPEAFFEGYGASYPLTPGWEERLPLYQFKELLLVIAQFGHGESVRRLREIIARFS